MHINLAHYYLPSIWEETTHSGFEHMKSNSSNILNINQEFSFACHLDKKSLTTKTVSREYRTLEIEVTVEIEMATDNH